MVTSKSKKQSEYLQSPPECIRYDTWGQTKHARIPEKGFRMWEAESPLGLDGMWDSPLFSHLTSIYLVYINFKTLYEALEAEQWTKKTQIYIYLGWMGDTVNKKANINN